MMAVIWAFLQTVSLKVWKWVAAAGSILLACLYFFTSGKRAARRQIAEGNAEVVKRQLETSTTAPKSKQELLDRLRGTGL